MRKNLLSVLISLCLGMMALAGCSDYQARKAGQNIQEQIRKAQRRCEAALTLMAGTPYKIAQEFAPLTTLRPKSSPIEAGQIQPRVAEILSPEIAKTLDQARNDLEAALREGAAAPAEDKALAAIMLGRIALLKGQYFLTLLLAAQDDAREALSSAGRMIDTVRAQRELIAQLDPSGALNDDKVAQWLGEARQEVAAIGAKISQAEQNRAKCEQEKNELQKQRNVLEAEGENFRIESRNAEGRAQLSLFDQYQAKQKEANAVQYRMADLESKIEATETELRDLTLVRASVEARVHVGEEILKRRGEEEAVDAKKRSELLTALAAARAETGKRLAAIAAACNEAKKAEDQAAQAYQLAQQRLEEASRAGERARDPGMLSERADAYMAEGFLYARRLGVQAENRRVIDAVTKLWGEPQPAAVPEALKELTDYVPSGDEVRSTAEKRFRDAEELYRRASQQARGDSNWLYEEALKSAQAAQAQLARS